MKSRHCYLGLGLLILLTTARDALPEPAPPLLRTSCFMNPDRVVTTQPDESLEYVPPPQAYHTWEADNSDVVYALGHTAQALGNKGMLEAVGDLVFVAVGKGGVAVALSGCHVASGDRTPYIGRPQVRTLYYLAEKFTAQGLLADAYRQSVEASAPLTELQRRVAKVLQSRGYYTAIDKRTDEVLVYSSQAKADARLCAPDECGVPASARKKERLHFVVVRIVLPRDTTDTAARTSSARAKYDLYIMPVVISRYRMQGGLFAEEANTQNMTMPISVDLAKALQEELAK
jgi:hypothetical protein